MTSTAPQRSKGGFRAAVSTAFARFFRVESANFYFLLGVTLLLVLIGFVMIISSSTGKSYVDESGFFSGIVKQITYTLIGVPLMLLISRVPARAWRKWAWWLLGGSLFLQILVFTPLGIDIQGNRNWVALGPINGQPSELVKVTLALWLGVVLARKIRLIGDWRHAFIPAVPVSVVALGLVLGGHDLGTVIIMSAIPIGALLFAGIKLRFLAVPALVGAGIFILFVLISPNRMDRILSFMEGGCEDYERLCWQPLHGTWALANGGMFGLGLGNSRAKYWLPAAENDYIFSIIGEELGLVGAVAVLVIFALLGVAFVRIIRGSNDPFARITTGAIMLWLLSQAFVNIAVVLQLLPVLGVPLPFISAGGTALITSLMAIGVVLSFARDQGNPSGVALNDRELNAQNWKVTS